MVYKQVIKACELRWWREIPCLTHPLAFLQECSYRQLCSTTLAQDATRCNFTKYSIRKLQEVMLHFSQKGSCLFSSISTYRQAMWITYMRPELLVQINWKSDNEVLCTGWTADLIAWNLLDGWSINPFVYLFQPTLYSLICITQWMPVCITVVNDTTTVDRQWRCYLSRCSKCYCLIVKREILCTCTVCVVLYRMKKRRTYEHVQHTFSIK